MMSRDQNEQRLEKAISEMEQRVARPLTDTSDSLVRRIRVVGDKLDHCIAKAEEIIASLPGDDNQPPNR